MKRWIPKYKGWRSLKIKTDDGIYSEVVFPIRRRTENLHRFKIIKQNRASKRWKHLGHNIASVVTCSLPRPSINYSHLRDRHFQSTT
uniref:Putative secreted protein n=1 Tax=Xenopsylla cheopis TaxID=163159 RepID=A0A6M2DFG2_XENCH